jgi:hypothetical protein
MRSLTDLPTQLTRTDPTSNIPARTHPPQHELDLHAVQALELTACRTVVHGIWADRTPSATILTAMDAVLNRYVVEATAAGHTTFDAIPPEFCRRFITSGRRAVDDTALRLRKNAVHGAYLALATAGLHNQSPAAGIDPVPTSVRTDRRGRPPGADPATATPRHGSKTKPPIHVRTTSHDEMLLIRLGAGLSGTTRGQHWAAAAVAICSASATTREAPQVRWQRMTDPTAAKVLPLSGNGRSGASAIAARDVPLDDWQQQALGDWHAEVAAAGTPTGSILYTGRQELTSASAQSSADQLVGNAIAVADLDREAGLSAGSLRLWAAARRITRDEDVFAAARVYGTAPFRLFRDLTH